MISEQLSNKFRICSFLATIFVVYRHSFVIQAFYGSDLCSSQILIFLTRWIANLTEVAVPLFFIISGFFFLGREYDTCFLYKNMIAKKAKTLFVPFVFWNLIGLLILTVSKQQAIPQDYLLLIKNFFTSSYYGPLWYVRDIMIFMLLVPLYQWMFDTKFRIVLGLLMIALLIYWMPVDCTVLSSEGLLFFILGGLFGKSKVLEYRLKSKWYNVAILIIWQVCCLFFNFWSDEWLHKCFYAIGLPAMWYGIDLLSMKVVGLVKTLSTYTFFVYVTHFYSIKIAKLSIAHFFHGNEIVAIITFLFVPLLVVACLFEIGKSINYYFPKFYALTTGNR